MSLVSGTKLGPYEILSPLGAGGMGEVYRAKDTKLGREVAVKVLPGEFFENTESIARFEREAKSLAAVGHPNIAALYAFEEISGRHLLVMELAEGQTLAERLLKGPLPLDQLLKAGSEIAVALDAAHRQGIVHRDLKPGNVMLTKSGVKLLDFGLAKVLDPQGPVESLTSALTTARDVTREGTILGTLSYMAPEQLEGKRADPRTDIFALGATLYEMTTGEKAFSGSSQASLISSIMTAEPKPISVVQPMTPPALDRVVTTCLAKDPDDRWQSAGDVAKELKWIAEGSAAGASAIMADSSGHRRRERLAWAVAALAVVFGAVAALFSSRSRIPEEPIRFTILPPSGQSFVDRIDLSPDGRRVVFLVQDEGGRTSVGVRSLDSLGVRLLPGTEDARGPFWSPDSGEIAFFSGGRLRRISAEGGPVQAICESGSGFSGTWNRQGTILFTKDFGVPIVAVSAAGGTPQPVTALDAARGEVAHFYPAFLPDGRHFVFVARNSDPEKTTIMLASVGSKDVRRLFQADSAAIYADPGYLLFARDKALFAWRFDPEGLKLIGDPAPALEQIRYGTEDNRIAVSAGGSRLAYLPWFQRRKLVWVDRKGRELGTLGEVGGYEDLRISPDGRRVAVALRDPSHGQNLDVWVLDAVRGTGSRITAERTDEFNPAWFPDGERLVYVSDHAGFYDLYERPASGGTEKLLVRTREDKVLPTISPDGRHLLYGVSMGANNTRVLSPLPGTGDARRLGGDTRFSEDHPEISPDGRWTAFDSIESGQREVYVQMLPDGPKRQVSVGGGQTPIWRRDGTEMFYVARDGVLMSVVLRPAGGPLEIGEPQPLFPLRLGIGGEVQLFRRPYDAAPDGQRFLVIRRTPDAEPEAAIVVTNWIAALRLAR